MIQARKKPVAARTIRCAIYTRQSVADETSEFNSIQAQRETVAAYVANRRVDGWEALPEQYDDHGFSGATTDRPAFRRLMNDVENGLVDIVAVYRLDRLSRSLNDFVGLMKCFEAHGVAFVSTTQQFDTSNSIGRLLLHLLASFAEFERSTISERTRDKMVATRKRGMWTGGPIPLGYDLIDKKLVVNATEAEQVRTIFATFLDLASITRTVEAINVRGIRTKTWRGQDGQLIQGVPFTKSTVARLVVNPIYVGLVKVGDEVVPGQHEPIVTSEQADAVRSLLRSNRYDCGAKHRNRYGALLRGLLSCTVCGASMNHTRSGAHRYYVCATALKQGASACPKSRVRLDAIEPAVVERVRGVGRDPQLVEATIAAAKREREAKVPELAATVRRLQHEQAGKDRERGNLIAAVGQGGAAVPTLMDRVAELDAEIAVLATGIQATQDELALLQAQVIDEDELRRALASFDDLWTVMFVPERERVLRLLVRGVSFDGRTGEVEVRLP